MSRCLRCGQDNENTARFCVGCGAQLSQDAGHSSASEEGKSHAEAAAAANVLAGSQPAANLPHSDSPPPSPQPGRLTPHGSPHVSRNSAPGLLPALIVPGTAALGTRDDFETAEPTSSRGGAPSASLAFAETAPPLVETDLNRPIPDRGARQSRYDSDPADPRMTFPPPEAQEPLRQTTSGPAVDPLSLPSDSPRVLSGFLVSYEGNALGQSWSVYQGSNLIGRLGAAAGADIELPHATVSSQHAMLRAAAHPGRLILRDQNSTNGSFVNDTALQPDELRELRDGDRVRFGLFTLVVKII